MARSIPEHRLGQLVMKATSTFIERGYRLTQMSDVAEALGVGKGTVYGAVESKEALFDACVRYADGHLPLPAPGLLPLRAPPPGATVAYVRERLVAESADLALARVLTGSLVIADPKQELAEVLTDLYVRLERNRLALKLVDRCAHEYPELANVWFGEGRWAQHALLVELLKARAATGALRAVTNPDVVARTLIETIAFWAMHRHFDHSARPAEPEQARAAVIDLLVHGLAD